MGGLLVLASFGFSAGTIARKPLWFGSGVQVYPVPEELDKKVARMKLESMGIKIDRLTPEQEEYLASWSEGT